MTSEQIALGSYWKALDSIWKIVHTPTKHTRHSAAADHYQADFDAIRKIIGAALTSTKEPMNKIPGRAWSENTIRQALKEHWLTGVHCDHEAKADTSTCYCTVWKSAPEPSVGAAVDAWIDHLFESF